LLPFVEVNYTRLYLAGFRKTIQKYSTFPTEIQEYPYLPFNPFPVTYELILNKIFKIISQSGVLQGGKMKKTFEALQAAIKFEEDGRTFFLTATEKTAEKFGKSTFLGLADAELDHINRIKAIYESLSKMGEWPDTPSLFSPKRPIKNVFEEAMEEIDQKVKPTTGEMEAVRLGIQYEEKGITFYREFSNSASHQLEKKFYTQLENEERGHMLVLKDVEAYYADPVHWFSEKEKSHWDGA
jgi:rubrerythrin